KAVAAATAIMETLLLASTPRRLQLDPAQDLETAAVVAGAHATGELLSPINRLDRRPGLEQEVLVAARAIKNMHLDAASPRLTHLDPEQVRDTVAVVVGHHPSSEMLSSINRVNRRTGVQEE